MIRRRLDPPSEAAEGDADVVAAEGDEDVVAADVVARTQQGASTTLSPLLNKRIGHGFSLLPIKVPPALKRPIFSALVL